MEVKGSQITVIVTEMHIMKSSGSDFVVDYVGAFRRGPRLLWVRDSFFFRQLMLLCCWFAFCVLHRCFSLCSDLQVVMELMDAGCLSDVVSQHVLTPMNEEQMARVSHDVC
jgi:hypothetical protein